MKLGTKLLLFGLLMLPAPCSSADEAFSNLGIDDSFNAGLTWGIGNVADRPNLHIAFEFTSGIDGIFESIEVPIMTRNDRSGADSMLFNLWSSKNEMPSEVIWSGSWQPNEFADFVAIEGTGTPRLQANASYWLSARSQNGIDGYGWFLNDQGDVREFLFDNEGGTEWTLVKSGTYAAFRINVAAIPEPLSGYLVATALTMFTTRRRAKPLIVRT